MMKFADELERATHVKNCKWVEIKWNARQAQALQLEKFSFGRITKWLEEKLGYLMSLKQFL